MPVSDPFTLYHFVGIVGPDGDDGWSILETWTEFEVDGNPEGYERRAKELLEEDEDDWWDRIVIVKSIVDFDQFKDAISQEVNIGEAAIEAVEDP